MDVKIEEIATRIKELREICDFSVEEMAQVTGVSKEDYLSYESGTRDFSFTFLYNCAKKFGVDITEIITGDNPRLSFYSITRKGDGLPIERRQGFKYLHLASLFKKREAEPFTVTAPYIEAEQNKSISLNSHEGQEMDYILSGSLKCNLNGHEEILHEGDCIYYDSGNPHGMIATGGEPCTFLAIVMKKN